MPSIIRRVPGWEKHSWLFAGFSQRRGGVSHGITPGGETGQLNLGFTREDSPEAVAENRRRLLEAATEATGQSWSLAVLRQVHGVEVEELSMESLASAMPEGRGQWEADGMITQDPGLLLGVGAADCVPILVADLRNRAVGGFHAGWRGTAAGMAGEGLRRMSEAFGTRAEDCVAAVGPSIGPCCYQVGQEVRDAFQRGQTAAPLTHTGPIAATIFSESGADRWQLDLWGANLGQLLDSGVPTEAISVLRECTACSLDEQGGRRYFSHRAEGGRTGRMLGVIGRVSGTDISQ